MKNELNSFYHFGTASSTAVLFSIIALMLLRSLQFAQIEPGLNKFSNFLVRIVRVYKVVAPIMVAEIRLVMVNMCHNFKQKFICYSASYLWDGLKLEEITLKSSNFFVLLKLISW